MIDWDCIVEGVNDRYHTSWTEKEMWEYLYPKYTSKQLSEMLGIYQEGVLKRLHKMMVCVVPRGHRFPNKWQKFCALIPLNIMDCIPEQEIVDMIGSTVNTIRAYKMLRIQRVKYWEGRSQPVVLL